LNPALCYLNPALCNTEDWLMCELVVYTLVDVALVVAFWFLMVCIEASDLMHSDRVTASCYI
jgi:hypothetical protein